MVGDDTLIADLQKHYTAEPAPPCRVCGEPLSIQSCGGGRAAVWGCDGNEDDPDRPGYIRRKKDRKPADDHYEQSRWTQYRVGDTDVLELIRRYQAALAAQKGTQTQIDEMKEEQRLVDQDTADNQRTLDHIANLIGLPHNQELTAVAFEQWFDAAQKGEGVREEWHCIDRSAVRQILLAASTDRNYSLIGSLLEKVDELEILTASPIPAAWNEAGHEQLVKIWSQIEDAEFEDIEDDEDLVIITIDAQQARAIRRALTRPDPAPEETRK